MPKKQTRTVPFRIPSLGDHGIQPSDYPHLVRSIRAISEVRNASIQGNTLLCDLAIANMTAKKASAVKGKIWDKVRHKAEVHGAGSERRKTSGERPQQFTNDPARAGAT